MNPEVFENCSTILIDIAGTVGSINFTKDTLFAFAKKNIEEHLTAKWEDEEVKKLVAELKGDGEDLADVTKAVERFNALTDENSVNAGLKTLQGLLYKQGYENGELKAHVFDDVKSALEEWSKHRKICVYSTGAEEAQKQYFTHSTAGDLTSFIANYFDLSVGKKTASESYESIAKTMEVKPQEIVFLSDDIEEIKAAATAGCASVLVTREGNAEVSEEDKKDRLVVSSFTDLPLSGKRKSEEEASTEEPPAKVAKLDKETKVEKVEEKKEEAAETMEVDSSEPAKPVETTEAAAKPEVAAEAAAETPKEKESAEAKTDSTEAAKVESTTETPADTTDKAEPAPAEKTEETAPTTTTNSTPTTTTETEVEKMDDTPAPASTTTEKTEKPEEKTEVAEAAKTEPVPEKEAEAVVVAEKKTETEAAAPATETKPEEKEKDKPAAAEVAVVADSTPETPKEKEEEKAEVKQNGKENGEEKKAEEPKEPKVEENGKTNGDAADEKENKQDIANGTAEVTTDAEKKAEEEVKAPTEEVKVKKIDEATEKTPLTVEA